MKLSKGKISKAIHKNKQTLKKYKRYGRKNHKSKTFRKRHAINLDRTTLKNDWIGNTSRCCIRCRYYKNEWNGTPSRCCIRCRYYKNK